MTLSTEMVIAQCLVHSERSVDASCNDFVAVVIIATIY